MEPSSVIALIWLSVSNTLIIPRGNNFTDPDHWTNFPEEGAIGYDKTNQLLYYGNGVNWILASCCNTKENSPNFKKTIQELQNHILSLTSSLAKSLITQASLNKRIDKLEKAADIAKVA